jgi:autotransporter-associated beta strand protein
MCSRTGGLRAGIVLHCLHAAGVAAVVLALGAASPAGAGQLPASAFQAYNPATAGTITPGPFALFSVPVNQIRPTQLNEGFTEIGRKTAGWDLVAPSQLNATLLTNIEPVVIGPGGQLYLTDGHHTFTSLLNSNYGASNPTVYVNVIANFSNLTTDQFFAQMQALNFLLPIDNGIPKSVNLATGAPIPTSMQGLTNDPYRGLEYSNLKNKNSRLFTTANNITGMVGTSTPALDKVTGFYSDFIWANAYRSANNGLGLPYLSPGDIALASRWNLNPASVTKEPNVPGNITVAQLPGFILPASITINGPISDTTLANGTLDGSKTGTFDQSSTFASFNGITSITNGTVTIGTPKVGFVMQLGSDAGGTVTLTGNNSYTGGTTIIAGTLIVASDASLGAATPSNFKIDPNNVAASVRAANGIVFNSLGEGAGTLQIGTTSGGNFTISRPIAVSGETATINLNGNHVTLSGPLASFGAGGIGVANTSGIADLTIDDNNSNSGVLTLTGNSPNFYGNLIIGGSNKPTLVVSSDAAMGNTTGPAYEIGQVVLNGGTFKAGASFSSVRTISLQSKSTFDTAGFNTSFASLVDQQRALTITNSASGTNGSVTFGSFEVGGGLELTVNKASGNGTTVTFTNGITRDPNATLLLSGSTLGTTAKIMSGTGAASVNSSGIAPTWIITDAGGNNPYDFATYGAGTGYVAFNNYGTTFTGSTASSVLKISGSPILTADTSALAVNFQRNQTVTGAFKLSVGDGTNPAGIIMNGTASNHINLNMSTIAFGSSEGIIYTAGSASSAVSNVINAQITGSGGLTLSGGGSLTLQTATAETGAIVVDAGLLNLAAADALKSSLPGVFLSNTKNLATANLALNQNQTLSALSTGGNNSFIIIDSTGTGGGSTSTKLTIGDSQNLNSTISGTIIQSTATVDTTNSLPAPSGNAVAGIITKNGTGLLDLSGMSKGTLELVAGSSIQINAGVMRMTAASFLDPNANAISVAGGAELQFAEGGGSVYGGGISGGGDVRLIGGILKLNGTNTYSGGTFVEVGSILDLTTASVSTGNANIVNAGGLVVFDQSTSGVYNGRISDGLQMGTGALLSGSFVKDDSTTGFGGNVTLAQAQGYTGLTYIEAGMLTLGATDTIKSSAGVVLGRVGGAVCNPAPCNGVTASLVLGANNTIQGLTDNAGNNTTVQLNGHTLTLAPVASTSWSYGGSITDGTSTGNLVQAGPGTSVLTGNNSYSGTTTVNGGALQVDGTLTKTSSVTVNSTGTLTGVGAITSPLTTIKNGGTFAPGTPGVPGTSMTLNGNLAFQSGAIYLVQIGQAGTTLANVSGTAMLSGNVLASFASGAPIVQQYDILHTNGGLNGTTFAGLAISVPTNFNASLSYSATDVFLNVRAALGNGSSLNGNQQNVANSINNVFNTGNALPTNFLNLFALTGGNLTTALSQLSGEAATGAQQSAFSMMTSFLGLMLDPTVSGRGSFSGGSNVTGYASDQSAVVTPDVASAYASVLKAPPVWPITFEQRWTVWGSAFGGGSQIDGDQRLGTNSVTARAYGGAVGADYRLDPDTVLGFALAGAGSNWSLDQSLGSGRSDAFQAGVYGITHFHAAYLAGSLGYTQHWITTNRTALGDPLTAQFNAESYGGRIESGYRFAVLPTYGVTPYVALQTQEFHTPFYRETDLGGLGFGLSYNSQNANDTRAEVGTRVDALTFAGGMPVTVTGRLAYAHDWVDNPMLTAAFQALPGASFIVNGAGAPKNSALTSLGAVYHLSGGWSVETKFDGEFASNAQTYTGKAVLQHSW